MEINKIPKQLQDFIFVKLGKKSKIPVGETWQKVSFEEAKTHNGNLAVIPGNDYLIIDCDTVELFNRIPKLFKKTFTVKTGKGYHVYYFCKDFPNKTILFEKGKHIGEIITGNNLAICPPSIHPNGKQYTATSQNTEIAVISSDEIIEKIGHLFKLGKKTEHTLIGIDSGSRDDTLFKFACKLRDDEYGYADALTLVVERGNRCNPPFPEHESIKCTESAYHYKKNTEINNPPKNLNEVYQRLGKWLYITDTNRIDLILAVVLSNQAKNSKPLWLFIVGQSGDTKSEILGALKGYRDTILLDQITPNTLATGKTYKDKKVDDLGGKLANSSHLLLFSDLASLKSVNPDSKNAIWGQFRELYEGKIYKMTGNNTVVKYNNCHVTLIACSTSDIKTEYTISNQLGTREFIYDIVSRREDNHKKMRKALEHMEREAEMKKDLKETVQGYLSTRKFDKSIVVNDDVMEWLYEKCNELATFRASAQYERITGELRGMVEEEVPTRLVQQMVLLYKSLKSLETDYPDEKIKSIIDNIVRASGDPIRQIVYHFLKKYPTSDFHLQRMHEELHIGRRTLKKQCEVLVYMGYFTRSVRTEYYGASNNLERDVTYYQWKGALEKFQQKVVE